MRVICITPLRPREVPIASGLTRIPRYCYGQELTIGAGYSQREVRATGLEIARRLRADWVLLLDSDERLQGETALLAILAAWPQAAYPIPYVLEDGSVTLAPCKLVRPGELELVYRCDYYRDRRSGLVYHLSGIPLPEGPLGRALLAGPRILHLPAEREGRWRRLSTIEAELEPHPPDALPWPVRVAATPTHHRKEEDHGRDRG